jgi:hypothetical protein
MANSTGALVLWSRSSTARVGAINNAYRITAQYTIEEFISKG